MEPPGYLDCVRSGNISVLEGSITGLHGHCVSVQRSNGDKIGFQADNLLLATGYKLVRPPRSINSI